MTNRKTPQPAIAFSLPDGFSLGGVANWSVSMRQRLASRGTRTFLLEHPLRRRNEFSRPLECGNEIIELPTALPRDRLHEYVDGYARVLPATIVPNWSLETYAVTSMMARRHPNDIRVLGFCHTNDDHYLSLLRYHQPMIHRFVAVSKECRDALLDQLPARREDILLRPYAVDRPATLERSYSAPGQPLRLLYAGRLDETQKRVHDLLALARLLIQRKVDFHLQIVGAGRERPALRLAILTADRQLQQRVSLSQAVPSDRMGELLSQSDVSVLVSAYEGTSIFMLESMARGCVPVVTDVSGARGVIAPGRNGFIAPVGNLAAMANTIERLDQNRAMLPSLGQQAHASVTAHDYEAYLSWFEELHREIWAERSRRWPASRLYLSPEEGCLRRRLAAQFPNLRKQWRRLRGHPAA